MSYTPLSKEQAKDMSKPPLIDDGIYPCELIEFTNHDKHGNKMCDKNRDPMTRIKLKIWDNAGKERTISTNIFWGSNNRMSYRTRHMADSFKVTELYESGQMYDQLNQCLHKQGYCEIYTQPERPKNDGTGGVWEEKNDVRDFLEEVNAPATKPAAAAPGVEPGFDDDVPF